MNIGEIARMLQGSVWEIILISAPMLIVALLVGLIIAILQATTSIQEQTMTFVPKLFAMLAVLAILGGWMFNHLGEFTTNLFRLIPSMAR
jgi:flagellar biosynthetic protein FliQ